MFLDDEESSLVPVFVVVVVLLLLLSPISTFSIEQSCKNGFKFGSHVQVMCKSCVSQGAPEI